MRCCAKLAVLALLSAEAVDLGVDKSRRAADEKEFVVTANGDVAAAARPLIRRGGSPHRGSALLREPLGAAHEAAKSTPGRASGNASIDGGIQVQVQIWLLIPRGDFDRGRRLYHPALESLKGGFTALGAHVSIVGRHDLGHIKAQLASRSSLSESHWIVIFPNHVATKDAAWLDVQECRKRGARLVVYNTEPGFPRQPQSIVQLVSYLGAAEIWEYSEKNVMYYRRISSAIARYVPAHYTRSLDYDVDMLNGPVHTANTTCVLQDASSRSPLIIKTLRDFLQGSLREITVNPATATRKTMRSMFMGCAIGLNLHRDHNRDQKDPDVGQMESLRMAMLLSNKMCVLSEGVDVAEMPTWDGLVRMPVAWKPDADSRFKALQQLLLHIREFMDDSEKLAECRRTSYELYKKRFSSEQVFLNAGINATMLRSRLL